MATIGAFTLKFNTDVSMAGTLRAAVAEDRAVVEQIRAEVEGINDSFQEEKKDIEVRHADVVLKHGEVKADRKEVADNKAAIDGIQANINSQQSDITTRHGDIADKHDTVKTQAAQVANSAQDVADDKAHVTQTVNNFNTIATEATQAITDEGDMQNNRVIAQGDTQEKRVIDEGGLQVGHVTDEGGRQVNRVISEGGTQTGNAAAEANRATSEAEKAKDHREYVEDFAGRFGDVDSAIAAATEQADESKSARDEAVAVVYEGEASLTPAPGKLPIARGDGIIESDWFLGRDTPFNAPLIQNRLLAAGTGDQVMMDVSEAGDGSVMRAVPYLYTMNLQGPEAYDDEGFKFGNGTILSPVPGFNHIGRTVSVNIAAIQAEQANTEWTPNYNGVNSYIDISEWKPAGEFEVACDLYLTKAGNVTLLVNAKNNGSIYISSKGVVSSKAINDLIADDVEIGKFCKFRLQGKWSSSSVDGFTVLGKLSTVEIEHVKGQVSNLKLIDKTNPENSRFYPGTVYSYVDPDATTVPMPDSVVLVDEWCKSVAYNKTFEVASIFFVSGSPAIRLTTRGNAVEVNTWLAGNYLQIGTGISVRGVEASSTNDNDFIRLSTTEGISPGDIITLTKVTHGILNNFGTTQPYVPLLGDREVYIGFTTNSLYTRGIRGASLSSGLFTKGSSVTGSFDSSSVVEGSILIGNGGKQIKGSPYTPDPDGYINWSTMTGGAEDGIQHAFQYPNVFTVIKPDDKDHPDYKEYDWTPNSNGVNSYVSIPEWKPIGRFEVEIDLYIEDTESTQMLLEGRKSRSDRTCFYIQDGFLKNRLQGSEQTDTPINIGFNRIKTSSNGLLQGLKQIAAKYDITQNFKGQISNLRLTDLDNPSNSRFYRGVITSHVMPTSTVLVDELCNVDSLNVSLGANWSGSGGRYQYSGSNYASEIVIVGGSVLVTADRTFTVDGMAGVSGTIYDASIPVRIAAIQHTVIALGTSGTLVNFGTSAPWVPHLEEGEGMVQNYNSSGFTKGIQIKPAEVMLAVDDSSSIADGSELTSGGGKVRKTQNYSSTVAQCTRISGSDHETQQGFQYPNTFKITPPSSE